MKLVSLIFIVFLLLVIAAPGTSFGAPAAGRARVNVFHAVAGGPSVDVQLVPMVNNTAHTIFTDLQYTEYTDYYDTASGVYNVIALAHQDHTKVIMQATIEFMAEEEYTLVLSGLLSDQEKYPLRIRTFADDNSEPREGKAKIRFIHVAGGFRALDVTLGKTHLFRHVGFGEHGQLTGKGYTNVESETYTMLVTEQDLAFDTTTVDLDEGDVLTLSHVEGMRGMKSPIVWLEKGNIFDITYLDIHEGQCLTVYAVGIRGSLYWGPDLVAQITREEDESSASTMQSWLAWLAC